MKKTRKMVAALLSTVVAVVAMPVWIIALEVIKNIGLFA